MTTPDPAAPRRGDRFVSVRGIGPDYRHAAVVTVTAVRRAAGRRWRVVYYEGDGVGRCACPVSTFPTHVRDPAGPDGNPDDPPVVREVRSR